MTALKNVVLITLESRGELSAVQLIGRAFTVLGLGDVALDRRAVRRDVGRLGLVRELASGPSVVVEPGVVRGENGTMTIEVPRPTRSVQPATQPRVTSES